MASFDLNGWILRTKKSEQMDVENDRIVIKFKAHLYGTMNSLGWFLNPQARQQKLDKETR